MSYAAAWSHGRGPQSCFRWAAATMGDNADRTRSRASVLLPVVGGGEHGRRRGPRPDEGGGDGRGLPGGERQVGREQREHAARAERPRGAEAEALGAREHGGGLRQDEVHQRLHQHEHCGLDQRRLHLRLHLYGYSCLEELLPSGQIQNRLLPYRVRSS